MDTTQDKQKYTQSDTIIGLITLSLGLSGDLLIGFEFINSTQPLWLFFHFAATLIWLVGLFMLYQPGSLQQEGKKIVWNSWFVTGALFGLFFYPGIGTLVYTIALLIARISYKKATPLHNNLIDRSESNITRFEISPSLDWVAQPLIDTLHNTDTNARLHTVASLGRYGNSDSAGLLRKLLQDPHSDIRNNASVTLARLEETLSQSLRASFNAYVEEPSDRGRILDLVNQYELYAMSGVLDPHSQKIYLQKARDLLLPVLEQEQENADLLLQLAQIRQQLGDYKQALDETKQVLTLNPQSSHALTLAMELAFQLHAWDTFAELNLSFQQNQSKASDHDLQWRLELKNSIEGEATHG